MATMMQFDPDAAQPGYSSFIEHAIVERKAPTSVVAPRPLVTPFDQQHGLGGRVIVM